MKRKLAAADDVEDEDVTNVQAIGTDASKPTNAGRWPGRRRYDHNASIVFIGPRATGTSSLAIIAASILGWKVVDCDRYFEEITGKSKQQFRSLHGVEEYRRRKLSTVREVLKANDRECVFACGSIIARQESDFFTVYASQHPLVYVIRERELIQRHLGLIDDASLKSAQNHMHSFFRSRSNYEYFNLEEAQEPMWQTTLTKFLETRIQGNQHSSYPQILRKTRALVSGLLRSILGTAPLTSPSGDIKLHSRSVPELCSGSHVLNVDLGDIKGDADYIRSLDTCYDAVQLNIPAKCNESQTLLSGDVLAWAVSMIRRHLDAPVIIHLAYAVSKDEMSEAETQHYRRLLHFTLRLAPEYITIDLRTPEAIIEEIVRARGCAKIIGTIHSDRPHEGFWDSSHLIARYRRARELGCTLVSISAPCCSFYDNIACRQVYRSIAQLELPIPVVALNTGSLGRLSQVLNGYMTPVIEKERCDHPPGGFSTAKSLSTSQQLRTAWHTLLPQGRSKYYVIGAEVKQSLSPAMHNAGFEYSGLPYTYTVYETADFGAVEDLSSQDSFGGASISLPFKSEVLALAARHSPAATLIGAANTLIPDRGLFDRTSQQVLPTYEDGKEQLVAENTDWMGIYACIAKHCTPANHITKDTSAVVIGAGGIARAAIYALVRLGVGNILILNRTNANAHKVKEHFEGIGGVLETSHRQSSPTPPCFRVLESCTEPWPNGIRLPSVIVNAIPARATEATTEYPPELRQDWLGNPTGGLIADLSWKRRATTLGKQLQDGKPRGWVGIDPIEILYEQGCAQFELFTNCKAPRKAMLDAFLSQYKSTYGL